MPLGEAAHVRFNGHDPPLDLLHHLVGGNGQKVDGDHHIAGKVAQFRNHFILDEAGIIPEEQHTAHLIAHLVVVFVEGQAVRGNGVPEVVAPVSDAVEVEAEVRVEGPEEVVEQAHTLHHVGVPYLYVHAGEIGSQFRPHPVEKGTGLLDVLTLHRNGDVLLLGKVIAAGGIVSKNVVVLRTVAILAVANHLHQDVAAELLLIHGAVKQGDLHQRPHRQRVEESAVAEKQRLLLFRPGHRIIDIKKPPGLGVKTGDFKDTILMHLFDGNGLLDAAGNEKLFVVGVFPLKGLNHFFFPSCRLVSGIKRFCDFQTR